MAEQAAKPHVPVGLGAAGGELWGRIVSELAADYRFDSRELALLERACTCADAIAALEAVVAEEGPTTRGSRGQTVVHPALAELRQQKLVLLRLLQAIDFGDDEGEVTPAKRRAKHAADARWGRSRQLARRRAELGVG